MKTFSKKDVYSWANAEDARQYIGKRGYFAHNCSDDLTHWGYGELTQIYPNSDVSIIFSKNNGFVYGLFLPEEKVTEVQDKKKYRPFKNCEELCQYVTPIHYHGVILNVGDKVIIRNKQNGYTYKVLITEICYESKFIGFGTCPFSLLELHNQYEWQDVLNKTWQPFGVEE